MRNRGAGPDEGESEGFLSRFMPTSNKKVKTAAKAAKSKRNDSDIDGPPTPTWKYGVLLIVLCGGALQVLSPALSLLWNAVFGSPSLPVVDHTDNKRMTDIFFGGEPHAILCSNYSDSVKQVWESAYGQSLYLPSDQRITIVELDCRAKLSSGKSTFQRFKIKHKHPKFPVGLITGSGLWPTPIPSTLMNVRLDAKKTSSKTVQYLGQQILGHVAAATKTAAVDVKHEGGFMKHCVAYPRCAVHFHDGEVSADAEAAEHAAMKTHKTVRWVRVDTSVFKLPLPPSETGERSPLVLFKKVKGKLMGKPFLGSLTPNAVTDFINRAYNMSGQSTVEDTKFVKLGGDKDKGKEKGKGGKTKSGEPIESGGAAAAIKKARDEREKKEREEKARERERERQRRATESASEQQREAEARRRAKMEQEEEESFMMVQEKEKEEEDSDGDGGQGEEMPEEEEELI